MTKKACVPFRGPESGSLHPPLNLAAGNSALHVSSGDTAIMYTSLHIDTHM